MVFKRKIYDKMLKWKNEQDGKTALLIKGARRVGKSTIVEDFAKKEYKSYILIDFANISKEVNSWFNDLSDLDYFFMRLQQLMKVVLYRRESVIIFDEIQLQPLARQAIKYLVKDEGLQAIYACRRYAPSYRCISKGQKLVFCRFRETEHH